MFAGRRCRRRGWHSDHLIVHNQWEHSRRGAHSCSKFPIAPFGKLLTHFCSTLACTTANASVNSRMCVPHRPCSSHRPHGRLTCCSLFAGRRYLCLLRHRHDYVLLDQRQHSFWDGACSCAKLPIAPMGKCLIDMSISILFVYYGCCLELPGSSTCYLCLKLQKFPSPQWENC